MRNSKATPPTKGGKLKKRAFLFTIFSHIYRRIFTKKTRKSSYQMSCFQLFFQNSVITSLCEFPKKTLKNAIVHKTPLYEDLFPPKKTQNWRKSKEFWKKIQKSKNFWPKKAYFRRWGPSNAKKNTVFGDLWYFMRSRRRGNNRNFCQTLFSSTSVSNAHFCQISLFYHFWPKS